MNFVLKAVEIAHEVYDESTLIHAHRVALPFWQWGQVRNLQSGSVPGKILQIIPSLVYTTVAILHDVIEDDPDWTPSRLEKVGFDDTVIDAVVLLTRAKGEEYESYIGGVLTNDIARTVKLADINDNLWGRLEAPKPSLKKRYLKAEKVLIYGKTISRNSESKEN